MKIISDSANLTLSGSEVVLEFTHVHNYFHVQNTGSNIIKISASSGISGRTDGVINIPSGGAASIPKGKDDNLYILGTGTVNVITNDSAFNPFRNAGQGGGGGGTGGTDNYPDLNNLPSIEGITLLNNLSFGDLGWHELTDEDAEEIVNEAFDSLDAIYSIHYDSPLDLSNNSSGNDQSIDTLIPQSRIADGFTAAFKINYSYTGGYQSYYPGLLGLHTGSSFPNDFNAPEGLCIQMETWYAGFVSWTFKTPHRALKVNEPVDARSYINQDVVLLVSDSADDTFVMINGLVPDLYTAQTFDNWTPDDNIVLFKSKDESNRYFKGFVSDVIIYDRHLSRNEAADLTNNLLKKGG